MKKHIAFDDRKAGSPKLAINERTNSLQISGKRSTLELVNMLVAIIDQQPTPDSAQTVNALPDQQEFTNPKQTNVYRFSNRRAGDVRQVIQKLLSATPAHERNSILKAEASSNSLIVSADEDSMMIIENLAKFLDSEQTIKLKPTKQSSTSTVESQDYSIENSTEYWQLIKQARQAKTKSLENALRNLNGAKALATRSELYQVMAQLVEADLHLKRIASESKSPKTNQRGLQQDASAWTPTKAK